MLKRISPSQVEMGMFIHKLEGSWLKHPFWRSKFLLEDDETLDDLRESEIDAVVIDISRGRDVTPPRVGTPAKPAERGARAPASAQRRRFTPPREPAGFNFKSTSPQPTAREFGNAARLAERGRKVVSKVFLEARLGKTISTEAVEPVIEDIFASIQRNPHAFNGLMRCKRDNEFLYRHALACSALMISLGRQLGLPPSEIREAGLAGLLFDVGINHLPVDLEAIGGDIRRVPPEIAQQHTQLGFNFLIASGIPEAVALTALHHHERHDGTGYPAGLLGPSIPLFSRMAAVCDTYDQLAGGAGAAHAVDPGAVLAEMAQMAGAFDPEIFAAFVESIGVYPIGTFVRLRSNRLAMVIDLDPSSPTKPTVRVFYSLEQSQRVRGEDIALSQCFGLDAIEGPADLAMFDPEEIAGLRQKIVAAVASGR